MLVQLCDLCLKALTMGAMLVSVDRLAFEDGVLSPQRIDFFPKSIVFRGDVLAFAHVRIVARQELCRLSNCERVTPAKLSRCTSAIVHTLNPASSFSFIASSKLPKMMISVQVRPTHPLRVGHSSENRMFRPRGARAASTELGE